MSKKDKDKDKVLNENSQAYNTTALHQIKKNIQTKIQRGMMRINAADIKDEIEKLTLKTYQEAARWAKECTDPAKKGEFFKNAGVAREIIQLILNPNQKG